MGVCKCKSGLTWLLGFVFVLVLAAHMKEPAPEPGGTAAPVEAAAVSSTEPAVQVVEGTIRKNTTLVATLVDLDVPGELAHEVVKLIQPIFDVRKIRAENLYRVEKEIDGTLRKFQYKIDDLNILKVEKVEEDTAAYAAKIETLEMESSERVLTAEITAARNNPTAALSENPRGAELAEQLAAIFAWDVDFNTDLQRNDRIRIVAPGLYHGGEFVKWGKIQAAELVNGGKTYRAFLFNGSYYDADGNSLKRSLLSSPLKFTRISSGFTRRRLHPILGTNRAHLAVDYAAPTGTPVQAVANGTVTFAGWNSGYGNLVQIKHSNGLTSGYAHLSRIDKDVRPGRSIQQGDLVGAVGQTGLATGPHLHFMMTRNGVVINPLSIKSEPPVPLDAALRPQFLAGVEPLRDKMGAAATQSAATFLTIGLGRLE